MKEERKEEGQEFQIERGSRAGGLNMFQGFKCPYISYILFSKFPYVPLYSS